jgi:heptosyltransferase-2
MKHKQNCVYFISDRPCLYHKKDNNITCDSCKYYKPINKKILIIKLSALGDVVRTTSILKPLKNKYKNSKIIWLTEDDACDILKNNPYVSEIIPYSKAFELYNSNFDILINLDLDLHALRITKNIFAEEKYGFYLDEKENIICSNKAAEEWFDLSHNDVLKKRNKKTYQKYIMEILGFKNLNPLDYPIIINLTNEEKKFAKNFAKKFFISKNDFVAGINLGGGDKWKKKEYPVEQTAELIKLIVNSFPQIAGFIVHSKRDIKVLLFGGKKEEERNKKIVSLVNNPKLIDTGCNNTLREFFSLIDLCDILITSDTLALHIALALKKKVVALFGPTSPNEIEMYGLGEKIVSPKKCVVCYKRDCNVKPDCMQSISPKIIYNKIYKFLSL